MSVQPISPMYAPTTTILGEPGDVLIINGVIYDIATLSIKSFNPLTNRTSEGVRSSGVILIPSEKGQVGRTVNDFGVSTMLTAPNLFVYPELKAGVRLGTDQYFCHGQYDGRNDIMSTSGYAVRSLTSDNGNYYYQSTAINTSGNKFLSIINYTYYNRINAFRLFDFDTVSKSLTTVHDWKYIQDNSIATCQYIGCNPSKSKFFFTTQYLNGGIRITVYDTSNQSITHLASRNTLYNVAHTCIPSRVIPEDVNSPVKRFYFVRPISANNVEIILTTVDTNSNSVTYRVCNVDTTGMNFSFTGRQAMEVYFVPILHEFNSQLYLSFYKTQDNSQLITFRINKDSNGVYDYTSLTFVSQKDLYATAYGYIALEPSLNTIMIPTSSGLLSFVFNGEKWIANTALSVTVNSWLYDSVGRLWIYGTDGMIYLLLPSIPVNITYKYERDIYNFTGSPINTYVDISAYNYLGQRIAISGNLKIVSGNATFRDNTISTFITTSSTADTRVPIIIKNPGVVRLVFDIVSR